MAVKISDLVPVPAKVNTGAGVLEVHGLSTGDITRLLMVYKKEFLGLISSAGGNGGPDYAGVMLTAPDMVADIIAMASDAVGQEEDVKRLPGPVQLAALLEIWRLSVPDVKKLKESLSMVMGQLGVLQSPAKPVKGQ